MFVSLEWRNNHKNLDRIVPELLFCKSNFEKAVLFLERLLSPKIWWRKLDHANAMSNREIRGLHHSYVIGDYMLIYEELAEPRTVGSEGNYLRGLADTRTKRLTF